MTEPIGDRHEGPFGWAERQTIPRGHPAAATTVEAWFMKLPNQGLGWDSYQLGVVSLGDIEGMPPPVRRYPEAEYELLLFALDPGRKPRPGVVSSWVALEPLNLVEQFHGVTAGQVRDLCSLLARECVQGRLPAETQMYIDMFDGSPPKMMTIVEVRDAWRAAIRDTIEHFRTGGLHARAN